VYCPQCRAEFREGFTECSDCHIPWLAGPPPPAPPTHFDPSLDPVIVLVTNDQIQLAMAKGLLEAEGIPFVALGEITTLVTDVDPLLHKRVEIQVPRDSEAEAREALGPVLQPAESQQTTALE
jgi:Putative prokaryotic signal transducing protein